MLEQTGQRVQTLTRQELERAGLSGEQCRRIECLRERYHPLIEMVETNHQWRQLQLLRWLYREGRYPRG